MQETITAITDLALDFIIGVVVLLFTGIVLPWLKEKRIFSIVEKFVQAAEKLNEGGKLDVPKKVYVMNQLSLAGIEITEKVEAMIEAAVKQLDIDTGTLPAIEVNPTVEEAEGIDVEEVVATIGEMISDAVVKAVQGTQGEPEATDDETPTPSPENAAAATEEPEAAETEV